MTAVVGLESAWLEYFARAVAADLGALKNRDEVMFRDGAHPRFLERINVLHESIACRLAIEAFLVRQLRSGRHAGKSNLKKATPMPSVARQTDRDAEPRPECNDDQPIAPNMVINRELK
jgi:hypothetical protein